MVKVPATGHEGGQHLEQDYGNHYHMDHDRDNTGSKMPTQ